MTITVSPIVFYNTGNKEVSEPLFLRGLDGWYIGEITKVSPEFYSEYELAVQEYRSNEYRSKFFKKVK